MQNIIANTKKTKYTKSNTKTERQVQNRPPLDGISPRRLESPPALTESVPALTELIPTLTKLIHHYRNQSSMGDFRRLFEYLLFSKEKPSEGDARTICKISFDRLLHRTEKKKQKKETSISQRAYFDRLNNIIYRRTKPVRTEQACDWAKSMSNR